jgi:O-antigen/teichoic acid export membrane protein
LFIIKKVINIPKLNTINKDELISLKREKKEYLKLGIFNIVSSRSDKIILSAIDPLFVGFLAAINSVVVSVRNNLKSILEWYTVRFVAMDINEAYTYAQRLICCFLLISFVCIIFTFIYVQDYIDFIFGKEYNDVVLPILLGSLTFPLLVLGFILKVFDQLVRSGELARKVSYIKQITNFIFCLLLIPNFSYLAPLFSLLISELLFSIYLLYNHFFQRRWTI